MVRLMKDGLFVLMIKIKQRQVAHLLLVIQAVTSAWQDDNKGVFIRTVD